MTKLFMVYLGGRTPKCHIELHDMRFVAGNSIEDTYPTLREEWLGDVKGMHLDSYMEVRNIGGYQISLKETPFDGDLKLYFINMGGYDPNNLLELHQVGLFVARSENDAKKQAKSSLLVESIDQHKDDLYDIDDCFPLNKIDRYYVHLERGGKPQEQKPDWFGYNVIG